MKMLLNIGRLVISVLLGVIVSSATGCEPVAGGAGAATNEANVSDEHDHDHDGDDHKHDGDGHDH